MPLAQIGPHVEHMSIRHRIGASTIGIRSAAPALHICSNAFTVNWTPPPILNSSSIHRVHYDKPLSFMCQGMY